VIPAQARCCRRSVELALAEQAKATPGLEPRVLRGWACILGETRACALARGLDPQEDSPRDPAGIANLASPYHGHSL
jgi:hypothetical protein